jgi:hypothetical protein
VVVRIVHHPVHREALAAVLHVAVASEAVAASEEAVALVAVAAEEAVAPSVVTDSQFLIIRC